MLPEGPQPNLDSCKDRNAMIFDLKSRLVTPEAGSWGNLEGNTTETRLPPAPPAMHSLLDKGNSQAVKIQIWSSLNLRNRLLGRPCSK